MQQFHKFITWHLCLAQSVSGASTPIIRSLQLHSQSLVLPWNVVVAALLVLVEKFITWHLRSAQRVSGASTPIIRSLQLRSESLVLPWNVVVAVLLVLVYQQRCYHHASTVKPETVNAVVSSWWWAWRRPKHVERNKTSSNKLVKLLYLVG